MCWILLCLSLPRLGAAEVEPIWLVQSWSVENGLPNNTVTAVAQSADGFLWVGTDNGLARFDGVNFRLFTPSTAPELGAARVRALFGDASGRLWLATADSNILCYFAGQMVDSFQTNLAPAKPPFPVGLFALHPPKTNLLASDFPREVLATATVCFTNRAGFLWVGTAGNGLWCRRPGGALESFTTTNGLGSDSILALFEDAVDALWVGCEGGGLARLSRPVFHTLPPTTTLLDEPVTAVCEASPNGIWIGTERKGVIRFPEAGQKVTGSAPFPAPRRVRSLQLDSSGRLWAGTQEDGLFFLRRGLWEKFGSLRGVRHVPALFEDDRWNLWLGTTTANSVLRLVGDAPRQFALPYSIPALDIRVFASDGSGGLWFGTQGNGLFHWDGRNYTRFRREHGLGSDTVWSLLWDETSHSLWIGTVGGGLSRLRNATIQTCNTRHGLFDDVICHILDDSHGWLWCSSPHGVFRISREDLNAFFDQGAPSIRSIAYGLNDGLPALECAGGNQPVGCRTRDGRLWWPTVKGLAWIDPSCIPTNAHPPAAVIDEILVDDQSWPIPAAAAETATPPRPQSPVVLPPGNHRVEFRYTALSWPAPELTTFRHRLEGLNSDWTSAGRTRSVHYNGLPPADYRFQVIAANRDGLWSAPGPAIIVRIQPHFWQTWWFRSIAAGLFAFGLTALGFWAVRRRHRVRLERLERLHAVERERARIAQDIHDDLGSSLTEIALLSELAQSQLGQPQAARTHLDSIFTSARKLARATDEIVWALHPKNNSLELSISFITRSAQEFLRAADIRCRLDLPPELPDASLPSAARHHLFLAVKEALNNVVKHAGATEVWLRLTCSPDAIELSVEDNGCGFESPSPSLQTSARAASGRGNGLRNLAQRMRAVGGRFSQRSAPGQGTVIRFTIPIHPHPLQDHDPA